MVSKLLFGFGVIVLLAPAGVLASAYGTCSYGVNQNQTCTTPSTTTTTTTTTSPRKTPSPVKKPSDSVGSAQETELHVTPSPSPTNSISPSPTPPNNVVGKLVKPNQQKFWNVIKTALALGVAVFGIGYLYAFIKRGYPTASKLAR